MIPDLFFTDTPSLIHFEAVIVHDRGSDVPWGTLYQATYGSNWILERRLSSTESELTNMGTTDKRYAKLYTREFSWDLAQRDLLNPPPQPSLPGGGSRQIDSPATPPPSDRLDKPDPGIVTTPQSPAVRHHADPAGDEDAPAVAIQSPIPVLRRVLRALLPGR